MILGSVLKVQDPDIDDIVTLRVSQLSTKLKMHLFHSILRSKKLLFSNVLILFVAFGQGK